MVPPEDIGALTAAPILSDEITRNEDGRVTEAGRVYWYREELHDILVGLKEENAERDDEIIVCCHCDASPASLAAAVREGWKDLQHDDGENWNFLGICPDCVREQTERERLEAAGRDMGLTTEQLQQANAEGVTTELGLRRIEKNTRNDDVPETIACARCDIGSPASIAAALQEGWTDLCHDDGTGWNYLGVCPQCRADERAEEFRTKTLAFTGDYARPKPKVWRLP